MSQLRSALRRAGGCAAALALIGSTAVVLAPAVAADSPTVRYVATNGDDTYAHGVNGDNDCTDPNHPCATIWQAANYDIEWDTGETTVVKVAPGTYRQTEAPSDLWICQSVEIDGGVDFNGTGAGPTIVRGNDGAPVIQIPFGECPPSSGPAGPPVVTLDNLDIAGDGADPGVAVDFGASVTITDSTISDSEPGVGVGDASARIQDSTLDHNVDAGVYVSGGTATVLRSTISNTTDDGSQGSLAGGVVAESGTTIVTTSTIAHNAGRGVLATEDATVTVTDSTVVGTTTGNTNADWPFGGLVAPDAIPAGSLARVRPMAAVSGEADPLTVTGSIVADNTMPDCAGTITDGGYNLSSDAKNSCGFSAADHDLIKTNPELGALQDNGGPTLTMKPAGDSPAIDAIPQREDTSCSGDFPTDQRGTTRPIGSGCDIGAVETPAAVAPPPSTPTCPPLVIDTTSLPDGTVGTPYSVQLQASGGCDSAYTWTVPSEAPEGGFPSAGAQSTAPGGEQNPAARRALGHTPPPPSPQPTTSTPRPPVNTPTVHSSPVSAPTSSTAAPTESSSSTEAAGNSAPPGLSLSADGVLSGTPTQAGTFTFTVSVNDPVLATLVLHVGAAATGTPTATATTPAPSTSHGVGGVSTTAAPPATATLSASTGPLANTGASVGPQLRLALLLLLGGGAMVLAGVRRRRQPRRH